MRYWDRKDVPHKGWMNIGCEDLESATHICDMCGKEEIRYVHTMYHSEMEDYYKVGCVCAEKMTDDYNTAKHQLKQMKKKNSWMTQHWNKIDLFGYEEKTFNSKDGRMTVGLFEVDDKIAVTIGRIILSTRFLTKQKAKEIIYKTFVEQKE
tara:strand:- start:2145 stop:2597 length:453 start_codon:yes stop_codon:yes gene_type:complete